MLLTRFTDYILHSRSRSITAAIIASFIPFGAGSIVAAFITLRNGLKEGLLAFLAVIGVSVIWYKFYPPEIQSQFLLALPIFNNFLVWLAAGLLYKFRSWSLVIETIALVGLFIVLVVHFAYPEAQAWWEQKFIMQGTQALQVMQNEGKIAAADVPSIKATIARAAGSIASGATGAFVSLQLFSVLTLLLIARWWQAAVFNPLGLRPELSAVRLSSIAGSLFLVGLVLSYWRLPLVFDVMPFFCLVFALAGISLIHAVLHKATSAKWRWVWLIAIYAFIFLLIPMSIMLLALLAFLDTWINFRKKIKIAGN